jgi:agmatinase
MADPSWRVEVVAIPAVGGLEIWNTATGARVKLPGVQHTKLPPISELESSRLKSLCDAGMIDPAGAGCQRPTRLAEGILGIRATTFADALKRTPKADIVVFGAPTDAGAAAKPGARHGPDVLRRFSSRMLRDARETGEPADLYDPVTGPSPLNGCRVFDAGDLYPIGSALTRSRSQIYEAIESSVHAVVANKIKPLLLGGDHSITAPAFLAASADNPASLIIFDAHLDAEDSGIRQFEQLTHVSFISLIITLRPNSDIYVLGAREPIHGNLWPLPPQVKCLTVAAGTDLICQLPRSEVYISIDMDVLDPAIFPATGHPVPGGITLRELAQAVRDIGRAQNVAGADIVEVLHAPAHDYVSGLAGGHIVRTLMEAIAAGDRPL